MGNQCNRGLKTIILIPCYNEEKNIVKTVQSIEQYGYDYIVINDGSTDGTEKVLLENNIKNIKLSNNLGIGGAMQTGYKYAKENKYDIAVQFDGDGQHNAAELEKIIEPIVFSEADMVIGSRFIKKDSSFKSTSLRRCGIKFLSRTMKVLLGADLKDMTSGFRAVGKELIEIFTHTYPYEYPEPVTNFSTYMQGYDIKEVPVIMNRREYGKSSITALKSIYYMANVILQFVIIYYFEKKKK